MPVFSYICNDCNNSFDLLVGVTSKKTELKCTKCGSTNIKKTFAPFGVGSESFGKGTSSSGSSCPTGTCPL